MKRLSALILIFALLCGCTTAPARPSAPETTVPETTVPQTTAGPVLKAGYYVPADEEYAAMFLYLQLMDDGTAAASIMGMTQTFAWTPEGAVFGDMALTPTADGLVIADSQPMELRYAGDALPEGFFPNPPAPGVYAISSVGYQGDVSFHAALSRDNGFLEILDDGTGTLVMEDVSYPFVLEDTTARFQDFSMLLLDMSDQDTGGSAMVMGYTYDGVIPAESIAFRLLEE